MTTTALHAKHEARRAQKPPAAAAHVHHLLHRAGQRADDLWLESFKAMDMTPRQYVVLKALEDLRADAEGAVTVNQTDLTQHTGVDRSTLADVVRRLMRKGWLERRRTKEDARAYNVKLTRAGTDRLHKAAQFAGGVERQITQRLSAADQFKLAELLEIIAKADDAA